MKALAPIAIVVALLAAVPLVTASNVMLNFLVVALLTALVGQGWNLLGGYGGQYSFGHAAFFGSVSLSASPPAPPSARSSVR
jgi:branched-chain amino acid transport system permease protein